MSVVHRMFLLLILILITSGCTDRNLSISALKSIIAQVPEKTCGAGEYLNGETCEPAGPGYYAAPNSDERLPCAAGYYCSSSRNTAPEGDGACSFNNTDPQVTPYFANAASAVFDPTRMAMTSAAECVVTAIASCNANFKVDRTNPFSCRAECTAGQSWSGSNCTDIPLNFYAGADDETVLACPINSRTLTTKSVSISQCLGDEGFYNCSTGTCSDTSKDASSTTHSPAGSNSLEPCPAGSACNTGRPIACSTGKYSNANQASCSNCTNKPANATFVSYSGGAASNNCPIGQVETCEAGYTPDTANGSKTCRALCAAGTYYHEEACLPVPAGFYTSMTADTKIACPVGSTSTAGNIVSGVPVKGLDACYNLAGQYCTGLTSGAVTGGTAIQCQPVPAGSYSVANNKIANSPFGANEVLTCAPGYDCPGGATNPQGVGPCGNGLYSNATSGGCQACTNRPLHAIGTVSYANSSPPATTATSCPIDQLSNNGSTPACDVDWTLSNDEKSCIPLDHCLQPIALTPGSSCSNGTYYVGEKTFEGRKLRLMTTPGGCSSGTPTTCSVSDSFSAKFYSAGPSPLSSNSAVNGLVNQASQASLSFAAAMFCRDMDLNSYTDWYLPAVEELQMVYNNISPILKTSIGLDSGSFYWSSTTSNPDYGKAINFSSGSPANGTVATLMKVRCLRQVEVP